MGIKQVLSVGINQVLSVVRILDIEIKLPVKYRSVAGIFKKYYLSLQLLSKDVDHHQTRLSLRTTQGMHH